MAKLAVNPTRMELTNLKKRLKTATRGHKLLKDKQDGLMKEFIELVKKNKALRQSVEAELTQAFKDFLIASAVMSGEGLEEALMYPTERLSLKVREQNVMSVHSPVFELRRENTTGGVAKVEENDAAMYPYGFPGTSADLDSAIRSMKEVTDRLIELAQVEKTCQLMADEIEKTRRRVNALEYVMIPQYTETIKYITMKLDENERSTRVRLMKVKDIVSE